MKRLVLILLALVTVPTTARAQQAKEFLVPPSGGTFEIPVHPAFVTALEFPERLSPKALASDVRDNYDVKPNGDNGVSVRPLKTAAPPVNINVVTATGSLKVSIVLRTVTETREAYTLVTFRQTSEAEAVKQRVADEVAKETASLRAELAAAQAAMDKRIRAEADRVVAKRALTRLETHQLDGIDRNDDNVIVRVPKVVYFGDDALVYFDIENRNARPYRLDRVRVLSGNKDVAAAVEFTSNTQAGKESLLGVVPASGRGQGVVVIRQWAQVLGRALTLVTTQPGDTGRVSVGKIVLR